MKYRKLIITTALAASLVGAAFVIVPSASAQGPQQGQNMPVRAEIFQACSTTDYTEIAAKALGMTATELRAALAGGKSLEAIAQAKQVDYQTVTDALTAAETADIDQAVKDGLLTQTEADALKQALSNTPQTMPGQNGAQGGVPGQDGTQGGQNGAQGGQSGQPNDMQPGLMGRGLGHAEGVSAWNQVKSVAVAADALGMTCVDLAKALQSGKSIATVAGEKNVAIQTVSDALVKAYQAALDKDVQEGLIAKVQADTESAQLVNRALAEIAGNGMGAGRGGRGAPGMPPMNDGSGAMQPPANGAAGK